MQFDISNLLQTEPYDFFRHLPVFAVENDIDVLNTLQRDGLFFYAEISNSEKQNLQLAIEVLLVERAAIMYQNLGNSLLRQYRVNTKLPKPTKVGPISEAKKKFLMDNGLNPITVSPFLYSDPITVHGFVMRNGVSALHLWDMFHVLYRFIQRYREATASSARFPLDQIITFYKRVADALQADLDSLAHVPTHLSLYTQRPKPISVTEVQIPAPNKIVVSMSDVAMYFTFDLDRAELEVSEKLGKAWHALFPQLLPYLQET